MEKEYWTRQGIPEKAGLARVLGITIWGPETEKALNEESDTNESILQRRIAWAKEKLSERQTNDSLWGKRFSWTARTAGTAQRKEAY